MYNSLLVEKAQIVPAFMPVNLVTAANNGDWVDMNKYDRCTIVFLAAAGVAGQDPVITVLQAKTNGGASKPLNFTRVDVKQGAALTAVGQFTTVNQAPANTYTDDASAEVQKLWMIEIRSDDLDANEDYRWIQANVVATGADPQLGVGLYILHNARYAMGHLPSAI